MEGTCAQTNSAPSPLGNSNPQPSTSGSSNIIFTILLCGFGLLLIYVIFRIKKLEMTLTKIEQRQEQVIQNGIRDWFQVPDNVQFVQHNCLQLEGNRRFRGPPMQDQRRSGEISRGERSTGDRPEHNEVDKGPDNTMNPLSGLMNICGMDLLGSIVGGAMQSPSGPPSEVIGVTISSPPPPGDIDSVNIIEIVEDDEDEISQDTTMTSIEGDDTESSLETPSHVDDAEPSPPREKSSISPQKKRTYTKRQQSVSGKK